MNSVLQGLFYCQNLRKHIINANFSETCTVKSEKSLTTSIQMLQTLFNKLLSKSPTQSMHGATIELAQYLKVDPRIQEDAQEFYLKILNTIQKETEIHNDTHTTSKSIQSEIYNLFTGVTENYITALDTSIKFYKAKNQKFLDLSLDIASTNNLNDAILKFLQPVILDGENQYNTKEYGPISVEKGSKFIKLPKILSVQLNRFAYDMNTGDMTKVSY